MGTFDSVYTNKIKKLQEENLRLKRFILEANVQGGKSASKQEEHHEDHVLDALRSPHYDESEAAFAKPGMIEKFHSMRFGQRVKGKGALSPFHLYEPLMGDNEHAALTALDHPQFSDEKSFGFDGGDKDWSTELIAAALSSPFGSVRTKAENKFGSRRRRGGIGIATDRELRRASNLHDYRKKEGQLHPNETFDYRDVFNRMFGG